ncbi:hypothetical protein [Paenibacillus sp. MSJ-34]|uniref:hypothetical protein n=1 Tax=Paenibacillus sp. MSJ-34 TaxID=2841529 RepID=UPI001C122100|nr:hypothetical protein [Paenibacillus sp. MSJ-34]MBU5442424.1 hypothetical protein [Paenibacillus sp. MSJ-34]
MKVRTILTGIAMAVALTGCSTQAATLDSAMPNQSPANQSTNVDNSINSDTVQISSEQNRGTDLSAQFKKEEKKVLMEPITLYEVDSKEFAKKTSEIPNYYKGEISYVTQAEMESFNEGHSVTLGSPLERTIIGISNLIPNEYLPDPSIDQQLAKEQGGTHLDKTVKITTANGIVFTKNPYNKETESTIVDVQVPEWGTYSVTWKTGQGSGIEIIQKITFQPEAENPMQGRITILELDDSWFAKKTSQIPNYRKGCFLYFEQAAVDSHNQGHSVPWSDPLVRAMLGIANLIPYEYLQDEAITQQLSDRKDAITSSNGIQFTPKYNSFQDRPAVVEVKVPNFGTYLVTMNSGTDSGIAIIQKIVFEAE